MGFIHEHKLNCKTRGLIAGPSLLVGFPAAVAPIIIKRSGEHFIDESLSDMHLLPSRLPWIRTYKISVRSRETGEELWVRPFATQAEANYVWCSLIGFDQSRIKQAPSTWIEGELAYYYFTVDQFTVVGSTTWTPLGGLVPRTDYLVVAGGGGGGGSSNAAGVGAGGAGAGGLLTATNFLYVTRSVTVGNQGIGASAAQGNNGTNSVFDSLTATGGGGGASANSVTTNGSAGGSGGGGGFSGGAGGAGTGGQGNNGGASSANSGGGGGGAGAIGGSTAGVNGGTGGAGTASAITGSSVTYAAGGGGGSQGGVGGAGGSATAGTGGVSGANGGNSTTANRGDGGGGAGAGFLAGDKTGGSGATGFVALSYLAVWPWGRMGDPGEGGILDYSNKREIAGY
jgi:hypothetical protein